MSFDQKVRDALVSAAVDVAPDVERSLHRLTSRHRRRLRIRRIALAATVAGLVALVPALAVLLSNTADNDRLVQSPTAMADLSGSYQAVITEADNGGVQPPLTGLWRLRLRSDGTVSLSAPSSFPAGYSSEGPAFTADSDTLRTEIFAGQFCEEPGTYTWRRTEEQLVLEVVDDPCQLRRTLLASTPWTSIPDGDCPVSGGNCLGPLPAGTYTATAFQPPTTYTVPEGWINNRDLPAAFILIRAGDKWDRNGGNYIAIYRDAAASTWDCSGDPEPGVGHTVEALTAWLTANPNLSTTKPQPVSIGGLDGVKLDLKVQQPQRCPPTDGTPIDRKAVLVGTEIGRVEHTVVRDVTTRLYLLSNGAGTVIIEVADGPKGPTFEEYVNASELVVETLQFG
jgi:hypothetical protein